MKKEFFGVSGGLGDSAWVKTADSKIMIDMEKSDFIIKGFLWGLFHKPTVEEIKVKKQNGKGQEYEEKRMIVIGTKKDVYLVMRKAGYQPIRK